MDKKKVIILFGGQSSEHEVSRVSAQSVMENIDREKFDAAMIGITKDDGRWLYYDGPAEKMGTGEWQLIAEAKAAERSTCAAGFTGNGRSVREFILAVCSAAGFDHIDAVFPVMHGCNSEDGTIQGLFELAGIPYVGPGVLGSALGMDKAYSKIIFENAGIPQGKYLVVNRKQIDQDAASIGRLVEEKLGYPCFVKPSNAGSSVGVGKARDREELVKTLRHAARYDRKIVIEEFINGREIECAVLGNDEPVASTVGEVVPCNEFYDYNAKYNMGDSSRVIIPAALEEEKVSEIRRCAVLAYKALDCAGLSRVDFFVHKETGRIYINEINTLPGFTSISMYPKLWEASGIPYAELIERLLDLAIERYNDNKKDLNG